MRVELKTNSSDRKVIKKKIADVATLADVKIKESCSILSPVLQLSISNIKAGGGRWRDANYCYIPEYDRYYFIDDIVVLNYDMAEISCSIDVLMTYQNSILKTPMEIIRSQSINSQLFVDPERPLTANKFWYPQLVGYFPTAISSQNNNYTITVAGG